MFSHRIHPTCLPQLGTSLILGTNEMKKPAFYKDLVGAVGIEPATFSQAVQCLCHSTSRKLVDGLVQQQRLQ